MNWDAIGAIGEIAGAIAVVVTLIYLAIQVRQNTKAMEQRQKVELASNYDQRTQRRSDLAAMTATNSELSNIFLKIENAGYPDDLTCLEQLTPLECRRLKSLSLTQVLHLESVFYQHGLGLLDDSIRDRGIRFAKRMLPIWEELGLDSEELNNYLEQ